MLHEHSSQQQVSLFAFALCEELCAHNSGFFFFVCFFFAWISKCPVIVRRVLRHKFFFRYLMSDMLTSGLFFASEHVRRSRDWFASGCTGRKKCACLHFKKPKIEVAYKTFCKTSRHPGRLTWRREWAIICCRWALLFFVWTLPLAKCFHKCVYIFSCTAFRCLCEQGETVLHRNPFLQKVSRAVCGNRLLAVVCTE